MSHTVSEALSTVVIVDIYPVATVSSAQWDEDAAHPPAEPTLTPGRWRPTLYVRRRFRHAHPGPSSSQDEDPVTGTPLALCGEQLEERGSGEQNAHHDEDQDDGEEVAHWTWKPLEPIG